MRELEINLVKPKRVGETVVTVDGQPVQLKKNSFGHWACNYQTENDTVNIKVYRLLDVGGFVWFMLQIFYFLISIFGLLDIHRRERCVVIDFEADVRLKDENKVMLQLNDPKDERPAIYVQTDLENEVKSNVYFVDKKSKKLLKGLMITKLLLALAIIATTITVVCLKFWG